MQSREKEKKMARALVFLGLIAAAVFAQLPNKKPTYVMNQSTIIMPCNNSGFTDPQSSLNRLRCVNTTKHQTPYHRPICNS